MGQEKMGRGDMGQQETVRPAGDGVVGLTSKVPTGLRPPLRVLAAALEPLERVVVAFSGGADSAFLSFVATECLGAGRVRCLTAVSPSLAPEELSDCEA
ncbi:MAG: hypothetical protein J2O39_03445, partial [Acidimicrobiales bacterium]|nr:hypothetical protein [Acidimicrobiales bacterium]